MAGTRRVGHLGTLDPDATGVLPLVIGRATRLAQYFQRTDKVYEAVIHFGWSTDSYDAAGEVTSPEVEGRAHARPKPSTSCTSHRPGPAGM